MNESFIGSIFMTGANFAPSGWSLCQGQLVSIAENNTMFALLGTTYGGDGVQTFGLPDLRGRATMNQGTGLGLSTYVMGQVSGVEQVTMTTNTMPAHTHLVSATTNAATTNIPSSATFISPAALGVGGDALNTYSTNAATAQLAPGSVTNTGTGIPFSIIQPVLAVNYIIAMVGIFPSRN